jgi:hypothetical protein
MILGFKQQFPWKEPTNFREKILLPTKPRLIAYGDAESWYPKIHTMREDLHNRWKPGMSIQMVYRGPKYSILDHFNKGIPELEVCTGVQQIVIKWKIITSAKGSVRMPLFFIDGRLFTDFDKLAANDGFDSWQQFCHWFKGDFTGKIIHWTDFRY